MSNCARSSAGRALRLQHLSSHVSPRFLPQLQGITMDTVYNGMPAVDLGEVRRLKRPVQQRHERVRGTGRVAERRDCDANSGFPAGPVLVYTQAEITAFLADVRDGEFDQIVM